jgi:hypothetical protein
MRVVIIGTIVVIVPFFAPLLSKTLTLLTPVFDLATCISAADDIMQISVNQVLPSAAFLWWSETAGRVPVRTLLVVMIMTLCIVITVECRVHHGCCVQHRLESLHVSSNFWIVFWQVGVQLIDEHP